MENVHPQDAMHAGKAVHFDLRDGGAIGKIVEGLAATCYAIPMNSGSGVKAGGGKAGAREVSFFDHISERNFLSGFLENENAAV